MGRITQDMVAVLVNTAACSSQNIKEEYQIQDNSCNIKRSFGNKDLNYI
jgi:hypothetical protein